MSRRQAVILGAGLFSLYKVVYQQGGIPTNQQLGFVVGFVAAAISGFFCIALLLRYLQRNSTMPFIVYRVVLGAVLFLLVLLSFHM